MGESAEKVKARAEEANKLMTKMNINQKQAAASKKLENKFFPNNCFQWNTKLSDPKC